MDQFFSGQTKGITLLIIAALAFLYFLPSVLSFMRTQKRFWFVLPLNFLVTVVQSVIVQMLVPGILVSVQGDLSSMLLTGFLVNYGPGWLALMWWVSRPGETEPRLLKAQGTKAYDMIVGLPLILWFAYGALQLRPTLVHDFVLMQSGTAAPINWVRFFSLSAAMAFNLLLIYLLVVRDKPVRRLAGVMPRLCALIGTFLGVGMLQLPVAHLDLGMQIVSAVLVGVGSLASVLVLWRLGKSFSIMPEARRLVTSGPYAYARHPLYGVEMITILGTALQFVQPWSGIMGVAVLAMLVVRTMFEERVLSDAYPEYASYRARTARVIPGVI
ncbi:MAG: isoprenylcysteine carboxylmethyltransferase family protein [Pseudomonadota bacterium]